jgi:hypothetical protein
MYGYYDFYGDFGNGIPEVHSSGSAIALAIIIIYAIALCFGIVCYILEAIGFYSMAKRRGLRLYGLAWVPIGNIWLLGTIADQYDYVKKGVQKSQGTTLLVLALIMFILDLVAVAFFIVAAVLGSDEYVTFMVAGTVIMVGVLILGIIAAVLEYVALYKLYASSKPDCAVAFTVLSVLFNVTIPFFVFVCRKSDFGLMPPPPPQYQAYSNVYIPPKY